ncbi:hypothetical protein [Brevundimonas nasdae]|uniref:Uncharacterized protein n=1 Tax=Brevundimonas nasdae TaxID=172043 RepID=A0ABX8TJT4_9CAUL|nr:hypothetical protein [Brevundimonas nasdae]QYC11482.1 hypothetical protein KWG56_05765 [Brevundimonas nasdae]QYC14270.1 hypothetical protein KWG63_01100 [Brevundimonas nasdae]
MLVLPPVPNLPLRPSGEEITRLARRLPGLHGAAITLIKARKVSPVAVCCMLRDEVGKIDLRGEGAEHYRRRFNGFYGVRRNAAWRDAFYTAFEENKAGAGSTSDLFDTLLGAVSERTGRVEASFVSKAVSAVRSEGPIIDSVIRLRLAALMDAPAFGGGQDQAMAYYRWLLAVFEALAETPEALEWGHVFDLTFADVPGASALHIHRKLDFLIWGGRSVALEQP